MSSHLIRKSHIHRVKHDANRSYVPFSSIRERLESEARESSMDFGAVSSYPRRDEDISSYPLDDHVEELRPQGTELKEIEEYVFETVIFSGIEHTSAFFNGRFVFQAKSKGADGGKNKINWRFEAAFPQQEDGR